MYELSGIPDIFYIHNMQTPGWKDYFSFTKKERRGIVVLLPLILVMVFLPRLFPFFTTSSSKNSLDEFQQQIAEFKNQQSDSLVTKNEEEDVVVYHEPSAQYANSKSTLFEFDPNTTTTEQWKKLGVRDKTIKTIQNYLAKGGRFKKPADLSKIYGLHKNEYKRLFPYIRITDDNRAHGTKLAAETLNSKDRTYTNASSYKAKIIEINNTDTSELIALPGIGNKLANRIINFRDKLGGFYSVDQIKDTYGLPDSTFQKIKERLKCDDASIKKININIADANQLKDHPYIKWNIANAIVNYRKQHGDFKTTNDLTKIDIISPQQFEKLSHYLTTE